MTKGADKTIRKKKQNMGIFRVRVGIDAAVEDRQIGRPVHLPSFATSLSQFLSSRHGLMFVRRSLHFLGDNNWLTTGVRTIEVEVFQQGFFAFIAQVRITDVTGQTGNLCLVVSKGNPQINSNGCVRREYAYLRRHYPQAPELIVRPLELFHDSSTGLVLYSSQFYMNHLEIGYAIDGLGGRQGLYKNSKLVPFGSRAFNLMQQQPLLEEMVKILTVLYDEEHQQAISIFLINAGDFILEYKDENDFSMRLVAIRDRTNGIDIPTFICLLRNYCLKVAKTRDPDTYCVMYVFNERTIFKGLVKAFQYRGMSLLEARQKADAWMRIYNEAGERGRLDDFLARVEVQRYRLGFQGLPALYHPQAE